MLLSSLENITIYTFIYEKIRILKCCVILCFLQHVYVVTFIYLLIRVPTTCVTVALRVSVVSHEGLIPIEKYRLRNK